MKNGFCKHRGTLFLLIKNIKADKNILWKNVSQKEQVKKHLMILAMEVILIEA